MRKKDRCLFLGSGGSMGIPVIGCHCEVCVSEIPENKRTRPSVMLEIEGKKILIDAGPDFRYQALRYQIDHLDGVIITHPHHDHIAGLDELRIYYMWTKHPLPLICSEFTYQDIRKRFDYMFLEKRQDKLVPKLDVVPFEGERGFMDFLGVRIQYFTFEQAGMPVNGVRVGNLAYVSDINRFPETIFEDLKGIDFLIVSALRFTPSPIHFSIDEAIAFSEKTTATQTYITHISHDLDHEKTNSYLPANISLAYDGLTIEFQSFHWI